ncbi:hypothetical protein Dda_6425 [Drechslerella dactyloides]|uniref:Amidase domain-containing protein n=1 Tax=Drechslerella dactyloides TaxID=74499 RepID=A0AAD6NHE3_DREDA|nr:hypothetical protein Dda_6425 [Drechslerella dactyloides]
MKRTSTMSTRVLLLSAALVGSAHGVIVKARHYDTKLGTTYDLNVCRPLRANRIVLLQEICDESDSMPGWRPRVYDLDEVSSPVSVLQLFGPPFGPVTNNAYEEPRTFAAWGGSLMYNDDPWKPVMFRTGADSDLGYNWRLPFEVERDGRTIITTETDLTVGDILDPIKAEDDTNLSMLNFSKLVSCDTPSGRVLRRDVPDRRILPAAQSKRYSDANCLAVDLYIADLGYVDTEDPTNVPPPVQPLDEISIDSADQIGDVNLNDLSTDSSDIEVDLELDRLLQGIENYQRVADDDPVWDLLREIEQDGGTMDDVMLDNDLVDQEFQFLVNNPGLSAEDALAGQLAAERKISPDEIPDLIDITIDHITTYLYDGCFTSVQLTKAYLARISEVNSTLHAVLELNPDALAIAASLDAERAKGKIRGPLHGVPILIKDNIATLDKMNNTAGSYALLGAVVPRDSTVAAKLRDAGVIILGKAGMSQWANYRSSNSSSGWSSRHGQITNAYYPNLDPSGSSSGSGVAASIGLSLAALGSETSGSIVSPSQRNNLVGIKPTVGLTSRYLVIPISEHQDTVGPMARTVKDAAYLLTAIAGKDPHDNYTSEIPFDTIPEYWRNLKRSSFQGAKIGIPRIAITPSSNNGPVLAAFNQSIEVIKKLGATIYENANFPAYDEYLRSDNSSILIDLDFKTNLKQYFDQLVVNPNNLHSLKDLINFTMTDPREAYPDRNLDTWISANNQSCEDNSCALAWNAYQANVYLGGVGGILGALESKGGKGGLDALIMPSAFASDIAAIAGYPVVTVPMGFYPASTRPPKPNSRGLVNRAPNQPFGLSFLGRRFDEQKLINLAFAYEQKTNVRKEGPQPYIIPNAQIKDYL